MNQLQTTPSNTPSFNQGMTLEQYMNGIDFKKTEEAPMEDEK